MPPPVDRIFHIVVSDRSQNKETNDNISSWYQSFSHCDLCCTIEKLMSNSSCIVFFLMLEDYLGIIYPAAREEVVGKV